MNGLLCAGAGPDTPRLETHSLKKPALDFAPFINKYNRVPEAGRVALWTFTVEEELVSFWGTLAEAISTASLYAYVNAMEDPILVLTDFCPVPRRVLTVRRFDN